MTFDPAEFEANVALKLIPTEQLPAVAPNAMEAGFDGPHVVRMAILDPVAGWEIDRALPPMMAELGCKGIPLSTAALRLAQVRALLAGVDHLLRLWLAAKRFRYGKANAKPAIPSELLR